MHVKRAPPLPPPPPIQLRTADGTEFFYSPTLGRASLAVPSQPRGGFLCEEMGLGKVRGGSL